MVAWSLGALIPSGSTIRLGGTPIKDWRLGVFGSNIIHAASETGLSGTLNVTAPQVSLSGIIANIGGPPLDTSFADPDYCAKGAGSSLTRQGRGGLKPRRSSLLLF